MKLAPIFLVIALPASATTMPIYVPGGAPCAGACTYEWAARTADVPVGDPAPLIIPAGSVVEWMSYAKAGQPLWETRPMILGTDQPGIGYWFKRGSEWLLFARLDACRNWAIFAPPIGPATAAAKPAPVYRTVMPRRDEPVWPILTPPAIICEGCIPPPVVPPPVVPPAPVVPTVPVPASGWLLAACVVLGVAAFKWGQG